MGVGAKGILTRWVAVRPVCSPCDGGGTEMSSPPTAK
jgi:hypothetical protein